MNANNVPVNMAAENTTLNKAPTAGRPKSQKKRIQILCGASELLLARGYSNTSMEAVAKASGVSKQTVYSHFNNKEALYKAIIEDKCQQYQIEEATICLQTQALVEILTRIGHRFIQLLCDENVISMYRLVIGESQQNNQVAQLFYDAGPWHSIQMVAKLLNQHAESKLPEPKAQEASVDFFNLLKGDFHMLSILELPYTLNQQQQLQHAQKVAAKSMLMIKFISDHD